MSSRCLVPTIGFQRVAVPLRTDLIQTIVPKRVFGAYRIYWSGLATYVGRSDRCIRARLLAHAASRLGTHFTWQRTMNERGAIALKSLWYHQLVETGYVLNLVHPARSLAKSGTSCPICEEAFTRAVSDVPHKLTMGL